MSTHPTGRHGWVAAALALGVLALGVALLDDGNVDWPITVRAAVAFLIGILAAALWWALTWLADYAPPRRRDPPS